MKSDGLERDREIFTTFYCLTFDLCNVCVVHETHLSDTEHKTTKYV